MKKFTVAVDADGVLYDLLGPWLKLYNDVFDDDLMPENINEYDLSKFVKCDKESLDMLLCRDQMWEQIKLYDGVYDAIKMLSEMDRVDLIILTATSYKSCLGKFNKILTLLPMVNEKQIVMTSRKDLIKADFLIDDWEDNLKAMASTKWGTPILVTQGYNRSFPNTQYGIKRAESSKEALQMVIDHINNLKKLTNILVEGCI